MLSDESHCAGTAVRRVGILVEKGRPDEPIPS